MLRPPRSVLCLLLLLLASTSGAADDPIRAAIITGENNHDWKATTPVLKAALEKSGRFQVTVIDDLWGGVTAEALAPHQVLVLNFNPTSGRKWPDAQAKAFLEAVSMKGKGVVVVHAANNAFPGWKEYEALIGGAWRGGAGHGSFQAMRGTPIDARTTPATAAAPTQPSRRRVGAAWSGTARISR